MVTSRYYRVADLTFGFTAEEQVFDLLPNYAPFEVEATEADLFHLTVTNDSCPVDETTLNAFFTDKSDEDMPRIELYRLPEQWLLCVSMYRDSETCCRILSSRDWTKATLYMSTPQQRFAVDNAAMLLYAFTACFQEALTLHASVIQYEGKGYFFLGKSGTGKSTHSRQWLSAFPEAELMNDDNPILRLVDGKPVIFGSPWSGKTPCYKNMCAPVRGIVQLKQAPENSYEHLRLPAAYAYMLSSSSGLKIIPEVMDALYATIATVVQSVPTILLSCLPNEDAARMSYQALNTLAHKM